MSVSTAFEVLTDATRRSVVELLSKRPHRAGELADRLGVSPQAMSRHLRVLRTHALVEGRSDEDDYRARVYLLRPELLTELEAWLEEMRHSWSEQMDSFNSEVERRVQL